MHAAFSQKPAILKVYYVYADLAWCSGKCDAIAVSVHTSGTALATQTGQSLQDNTIYSPGSSLRWRADELPELQGQS